MEDMTPGDHNDKGQDRHLDTSDLLDNFSSSGNLPGLKDQSDQFFDASSERRSENLNGVRDNSCHYSHFILPKLEIEPIVEHGIDKKLYARERTYTMEFLQKVSQTFFSSNEPDLV